jgi:hypothetical protein
MDMFRYTDSSKTMVREDGTTLDIPVDPSDRLWRKLVAPWLAEGNEIAASAPAPSPTHEQLLAETDAGMARFAEDLFDALKTKGVLTDDDMPAAAVEKVEKRKELRAKL